MEYTPNAKSVPPTLAISGTTWIMCAVSLRGQDRFKFRGYNAYCWDGRTVSSALEGAYLHDEAVYGVEYVDEVEAIGVDIPFADGVLPDSRTGFPVS